jgi:putative transposase
LKVERRKLDRHGIRVDYLDYYSEDLQFLVRNRKDSPWVDIRRDPLDIRRIYVLHPIRKEWIAVHTRHVWMSVASLFELKKAKKEARRRKLQPTAQLLWDLIEQERKHVETAEKATKKARREDARRNHHKRLRKAAPSEQDVPPSNEMDQNNKKTKANATKPHPQAGEESRSVSDAALTTQDTDLASLLANVTDKQLEDCLDGA